MDKIKKPVDPSFYTKEYYLSDCTGFEEFKESYGEKLEPRFQELIKHLKIKPGDRVFDVGCGRGELVFFAGKNNAYGVGIDYSKAAIMLARLAKTKKHKYLGNRAKFYLMNAKKIRFRDSAFDIVVLADVVEHLYNYELSAVFKNIKKVLKKDGIVVIHTAPNKLFNDIFYKHYCYPISTILLFFWNLFFNKRYPNIEKPSKLRTDSHKIMHINEPTYFSLKRLFKENNFVGHILSTNITVRKPILSFKDYFYNLIVFLDPISRIPPFNIFFGSDFVCVLKNKK